MNELARGEIVSVDSTRFCGWVQLEDTGVKVFFRFSARRSVKVVNGQMYFGSNASHSEVSLPKKGDRIVGVLGEDSHDRPRVERFAYESEWDKKAAELHYVIRYRIIASQAGVLKPPQIIWMGVDPSDAPIKTTISYELGGVTLYFWEIWVDGKWKSIRDPRYGDVGL